VLSVVAVTALTVAARRDGPLGLTGVPALGGEPKMVIDRLAQTAAGLTIVQHCHHITPPVVNMLKTYANNPRNPKRYMTIDGYDTIKILRHLGRLRLRLAGETQHLGECPEPFWRPCGAQSTPSRRSGTADCPAPAACRPVVRPRIGL
jgi:hypothetical protein